MLAFEVRVSSSEPTIPELNSADGKSLLFQRADDTLLTVAVAPVPLRH